MERGSDAEDDVVGERYKGPREAKAYYAGRKPRVVSDADGRRVVVVNIALSHRRTIMGIPTSRSVRMDVDYYVGVRGTGPWDGRRLLERQGVIREAMRREGYEVRVRKDEDGEMARANADVAGNLEPYVD